MMNEFEKLISFFGKMKNFEKFMWKEERSPSINKEKIKDLSSGAVEHMQGAMRK